MKNRKIILLILFTGISLLPFLSRAEEPLNPSTLESRIDPPAGYIRQPVPSGSFAYYLRNLPLLPSGSKVKLYNGKEKPYQQGAFAVVDMEIGNRDLQQCADAIIRLRAEYLFRQKRYQDISFNFTNGFKAEYSRWAKGERIRVNGNQVSWYTSRETDYSYPTFRAYLDQVFIYAGTASLAKELKTIPYHTLQTGDVLIQGGYPGHAVIVADIAIHPETGKKVYLLAQSYMPAQDIHILVNPTDPALSPWYEPDSSAATIRTPEWTFYPADLKRFP